MAQHDSALSEFGWSQTRKRYFVLADRETDPVPIDEVLEPAWTRDASGVGWLLGLAAEASQASDPLTLPTAHSKANQRCIDFLFDEDLDGLPNAERPECHQRGTPYSASYGRMSLNRPAPTITTGSTSPGRGRFIHPLERRTVNPREAALIQGFPLDYPFVSDREVPSRTSLATWIVNAATAVLAPVFGAGSGSIRFVPAAAAEE